MTLPRAPGRLAAFDSLQNRNFRWFWLGRLASSASMEMGTVARGWLTYQLTGSAVALGWVSAGRSIARLILSLYGGALADRFEKRQLLIWTRAIMLVNTLVIAVLILTGAIRVMYMMTMGLMPLGTIPAGAVADTWGAPAALMLQGALMAAIFVTFWLTRSRVRKLA